MEGASDEEKRVAKVVLQCLRTAELRGCASGVPLSVLDKSFGVGFEERYTMQCSLREFLARSPLFVVKGGRVFPRDSRLASVPNVWKVTDSCEAQHAFHRGQSYAASRRLRLLSFADAVATGSLEAVTLVAERNLRNVNDVDSESRTALMLAAEGGDEGMVALLLRVGADHTIRDAHNGWSALFYAAKSGKVGVVRQLIGAGAQFNLSSHKNDTPLHLAAASGSGECVRELLSVGLRPSYNNNMESPLHVAAVSGSVDALRTLLQIVEEDTAKYDAFLASVTRRTRPLAALMQPTAPCQVAAPCSQGMTALHKAASAGRCDTLVTLLDSDASVVHHADNRGRTPLHHAVLGRHRECVEELTARGASNTPDIDGLTPVHHAAKGATEILLLLLNRFPDSVAVCDKAGYSPLHVAAEEGAFGCFTALADSGAEMRTPVAIGYYHAVHLAASHGHREIIEYIAERHPSEVDTVCPHTGTTPLHVACLNSSLEGVLCLLELGADVNAIDKDGNTVLHMACIEPTVPIVRALLQHPSITSATLLHENHAGDTALHNARRSVGTDEVVSERAAVLIEEKIDALVARETAERLAREEELRVQREQEEAAAREREAFERMLEEEYGGMIARVFSYDVLRLPDSTLGERDINTQCREMYLSDDDFKAIFGVDKEKFKTWPPHKRELKKQAVGLQASASPPSASLPTGQC